MKSFDIRQAFNTFKPILKSKETLTQYQLSFFVTGFKLFTLQSLFGLLSVFFLYNCSTSQKSLSPGIEVIRFSGKIISPPKSFLKNSYKFQIRFYNCPSPFGKQNPDTGTYKFTNVDCRKNYYEKDFSSNKNEYTVDINSPEKWTHAYIRILETEPIEGMFSPGENPYWFSKADGNNLLHNFDFESMENPIPNLEGAKLAEKFAPIIAFKKDKKYLPSNLEKFSKFHKIQTYTGKNKDSELYEINDLRKNDYFEFEETKYGGDTYLYYHVRPADTMVSGTSPKALPGWRDNRNYRYAKSKGDIVISYYLWYDYNEGPSRMGNKHEGDFESFAILIDANGNAKRFMTTGHNHVMLDTSWNNINSIDNHPIIYIAHGNHGRDGGNPTSPYGGFETSLEAGNFLFNLLANPKDIFPGLEESHIIIPKSLNREKLKSVRVGPGEWIDKSKTRMVNASGLVIKEISKLVNWEEPGWIGKEAVSDPDKNHNISEESLYYQNFGGRLGKHPRGSIKIGEFKQYGKSPVNPPFKMNEEQHFTYEKPYKDRCEKVRIGDYCPKFIGDSLTPQ